MLSNASKYAVRAIFYLAIHSHETNKIGAKKISKELEMPQAFLAQLLRNLSSHKIVSSVKGPGGGFFLDNGNRKKSIWDVIVSIDGKQKFDECFLGLAKCNEINPCPAHAIVAPFKEKILTDFRDKTIDQLVEEIKKNGTVISLKGLDLNEE
ncbi:RrF2 family transcriptional regulator [Maribacter hydrothermalis]|uniref:Rrf2 family transcriptional regulator n=1 Tax=Maribacter hydrothermalis TaxID=1836467 RepID=A0A1B7YXL9_9FLAO|nr:Rrf2 family transcriptional regulator [Maribacter hydrothermalis]APQ16766.1 transcriptional regulator [Maribacter hydrothermalis]OBR35193.1 Rrf2 family transcriptional regulator [Maribacter hydrothermalis]